MTLSHHESSWAAERPQTRDPTPCSVKSQINTLRSSGHSLCYNYSTLPLYCESRYWQDKGMGMTLRGQSCQPPSILQICKQNNGLVLNQESTNCNLLVCKWNVIGTPSHWSTLCGCFCTMPAELRNWDRNCMAHTASIFTIWPFVGKTY